MAIKRKLIDGASAVEVIDDFFDNVAGEPGFSFDLYLGPDWLHDAIARACEEVSDKPTGHSSVLLVAAPQHQLLHGSVVLDGYMGSVVYFEDIRLGAVALFPDDLVDTSLYLRLVIHDELDGADEPPS